MRSNTEVGEHQEMWGSQKLKKEMFSRKVYQMLKLRERISNTVQDGATGFDNNEFVLSFERTISSHRLGSKFYEAMSASLTCRQLFKKIRDAWKTEQVHTVRWVFLMLGNFWACFSTKEGTNADQLIKNVKKTKWTV